MNSKKFHEIVKREWEHFIQTGTYNENVIRKEIADSWKRCKDAGIDPYGGVCNHVLEGKELNKLLDDNKELIEISKPILYGLYSFLKGSGFYVALVNADLYLLDFFGDPTMEKAAARINFMKGACWKEEYVGSTTLGIMPYFLAPLQMAGAEHYCIMSQDFTCSAAPIISETGEFLGLVNVSGPGNDVHKHTLGMVVAAVEAIRNSRIIIRKNRQLQSVNKRMTKILETVSEAIVVYDNKKKIELINPAAAEIIGIEINEETSIDMLINTNNKKYDIFDNKEFYDIECTLLTKNGEMGCLVSGMPIMEEESVTGTVAVIRPLECVQKLVKRYGNMHARICLEDVVGGSPEIKNVIRMAERVAKTDANILLQGESGTGKEVFAQSIHNLSRRREGPYIAVNCGAIPRDLVASELFGYTEGAFTGAARGGRPGKFELASKGTIFLDEIGDMPLEQQVNLLRVLQERRITRIGDGKEIPVDVRVICASNKSLKDEMERGNFRQDLFYRLNIISIEIPPLRDRGRDIEYLFRHFVSSMVENSGYRVKEIDPKIFHYLCRYRWPGNVRELQNVAERMLNFSLTDTLTIEDLPEEIFNYCEHNSVRETYEDSSASRTSTVSIDMIRKQTKQHKEDAECQAIRKMLLEHNGNISQAAQAMDLSRNTLYRKMRKYGIG